MISEKDHTTVGAKHLVSSFWKHRQMFAQMLRPSGILFLENRLTAIFENERVPIIQVVPLTEWNPKKAKIQTNVDIEPSPQNGLTKRSIADGLQTRPVDHRSRMVSIRGTVELETLARIDQSLKIVFALT